MDKQSTDIMTPEAAEETRAKSSAIGAIDVFLGRAMNLGLNPE